MHLSRALTTAALACSSSWGLTAPSLKPDITVAADGSGDFKTVQAAVASIPATNLERTIVFIKDGLYKEKVRIDASFVTLRGQSRRGTRLEYAQLTDDFTNHPDALGKAVVNLSHANDFVLQNLTAANTAGIVGPHAFAVDGTGDRCVMEDCDLFSAGADTVGLGKGEGGRHYLARCNFRGSVDFLCPRGWCYLADSTFYEMKNTAAVWHDGHWDPDMKFVLNRCKFDGVPGWNLARHHVDAQFFFLNCAFSQTMTNEAPFRVIYPDNPKRNAELDKSNLWGERAYFYHCHRAGGDYAWQRDNLESATNAPAPAKVCAAWAFGGTWDPEEHEGPAISEVAPGEGRAGLIFNEPVTVKGKPRLVFGQGGYGTYLSGSGTTALTFLVTREDPGPVKTVEVDSGAIIASRASDALRIAGLQLPEQH